MSKIFLKLFAKQLRRPTGLFGKFVAGKMEAGNYKMYESLVSQVDFSNAKNIMEIGYGTAKALNIIAEKQPEIKLYGIDFSEVMYKKALQASKNLIENKRMFLDYGDLLDYAPPLKFDIIYCINVIYFWNDLEKYLRKVYALLNNGGCFYINMADPETLIKLKVGETDTFNKHYPNDVVSVLEKCGFNNIGHTHVSENNLTAYCIKAKK